MAYSSFSHSQTGGISLSEYTPTSKTETEETIMNPDPVAEAPDPEIRAEKEMEPVSEEEPPKRLFSPFRSKKSDFSRDEWILSHIDNSQLMEYLKLEQKRFEQLQEAKERKEKRLFTAFKLSVSLAAIVAVIYLLKDVPTILVNILYIAGILAAFWLWKNPKDKNEK